MSMNRGGRPTSAQGGQTSDHPTFTGNKALQIEEPLIFEVGDVGKTGVDFEEPEAHETRLGGLERQSIGLPGLTEPEAMRHYVRISQKNFAIDAGVYPLGSCTMKHNGRLNEKMARLPGFGDVHPLQPQSTVQGALELIDTLAAWLLSPCRQRPGRMVSSAVWRPSSRRKLPRVMRARWCWCRSLLMAPTPQRQRCLATRCAISLPVKTGL